MKRQRMAMFGGLLAAAVAVVVTGVAARANDGERQGAPGTPASNARHRCSSEPGPERAAGDPPRRPRQPDRRDGQRRRGRRRRPACASTASTRAARPRRPACGKATSWWSSTASACAARGSSRGSCRRRPSGRAVKMTVLAAARGRRSTSRPTRRRRRHLEHRVDEPEAARATTRARPAEVCAACRELARRRCSTSGSTACPDARRGRPRPPGRAGRVAVRSARRATSA